MEYNVRENVTFKSDVLIVGSGPSGASLADEIMRRDPEANVIMLDAGHPIGDRFCPRKLNGGKCVNCKVCAIMSGFGGAGAFSDGKYTLTQGNTKGLRGILYYLRKGGYSKEQYHIGGTSPKYYGLPLNNYFVMKQFRENIAHGAPNNIEKGSPKTAFVSDFDRKLKSVNLQRADAQVNHIGTTEVQKLYEKYQQELLELGVDLHFNTLVDDIIYKDGRIIGVKAGNRTYLADTIVFATGRSGAKWLQKMAKKYKWPTEKEGVDLGLRVEVPDSVMAEVNKALYEAKIIGNYPVGNKNIQVRMFCTNPSGEVVIENADGIAFVNGHADNKPLSSNTNFAILASYKKDVPNPSEWVRMVAKRINDAGKGQPIVQRWGDLLSNVPTTKEKLDNNSVKPSLKGTTPGNMYKLLPPEVFEALKKYMDDLNKVIPGIAADDILVYGLEAKFCNPGIKLTHRLQLFGHDNVFIIGDAGCTHGLASASATGRYVANVLFPSNIFRLVLKIVEFHFNF